MTFFDTGLPVKDENLSTIQTSLNIVIWMLTLGLQSEAEFKEFEQRLKFETWLKYGWFYLKLY